MYIYNIFEIAAVIIFLLILYRGFCWKPKVKPVKAPTTRQIRRQRKRARRLRKISRRFKVPHVGQAEVIGYDKKKPCIDSMWDEVERKK